MRLLLDRLRDAWATSLALFSLAGLAFGLLPGREAWTWLWVHGPAGTPEPLRAVLVLGFAVGLLARRPRLVAVHRVSALGLALLALLDAARVLSYADRSWGPRLGFPVPESLITAALLLLCALRGPATWPATLPWRRAVLVLATGATALLGHVAIVGTTDHGRAPGPIVVLGARVHADGRPSGALEDRVATACRLYRSAEVKGTPLLVLSGGAGPGGGPSEPEVMARLCRERGVPEEAMILDLGGATTADSAASIRRLADRHRWRSVHVVSHGYHLARVQVAFRDVGLTARVVPCRETHAWPLKPLAVLRELPAILAYLVSGRGAG